MQAPEILHASGFEMRGQHFDPFAVVVPAMRPDPVRARVLELVKSALVADRDRVQRPLRQAGHDGLAGAGAAGQEEPDRVLPQEVQVDRLHLVRGIDPALDDRR